MGALIILALASTAAGGTSALPLPQLDIAVRVAGSGLPQCTSYHPDGSEGPCLPHFALRQAHAINAWRAGGQITVTSGAAEALTGDEFALLAGHEIAHWLLGHRTSSPEAELAADRLGAKLACAAGFDLAAGVKLFTHLNKDHAHPSAALRTAALIGTDCRPGPSAGTQSARLLPQAQAGAAGSTSAQ